MYDTSARLPAESTGASPSGTPPAANPGDTSRAATGWSPGALAAAVASALTAVTASWQPWFSPGAGAWLDALINEWIIWFAVFYLGLLVAVAVLERLTPGLRRFRSSGDPTTRDLSSSTG